MSPPDRRGTADSEFKYVDAQLLRVRDLVRLTGLSRATLNRLVRSGNFPHAVQITQRVVAWRKRDVVNWLESRPKA